jgi:anti-anti-sigma regulatory factor
LKRNTIRELTIEHAVGYRKQLLEIVGKGNSPTVDLSELESIDLSGLQILVAFLREAASVKRDAHLAGSLGVEVQRAIGLSGLCDHECPTGESLESAIRVLL